MTETVAEWKARKRAQVRRVKELRPDIGDDPGFDYSTKFILICRNAGQVVGVLVIGQLEREAVGQKRIDLTDAQIDAWVASLPAAP